MRSTPDYERLGEAYAVIDGIPDDQITLDIERFSVPGDVQSIGMNEGRYLPPTDWNALVLTPDVWLSLEPRYLGLVQPLIEYRESYGAELFWRIEGRLTSRFEVAMAYLFKLSEELAEDLFGMRGEDEADNRSDKQVFLDRIRAFLRKSGQAVDVGIQDAEQQKRQETTEANHSEDSPGELPSNREVAAERSQHIQSGFAVMASEDDTPGAETFDSEAAASMTDPIVHAQSIENNRDDQ